MPKRKGITISLAAKCQLLFGLAVLVIIAGALAVPWQRMEQLAGQPNVNAARIEADSFLRWLHVNARPAERNAAPAASPTTTTAPFQLPLTISQVPPPTTAQSDLPIPNYQLPSLAPTTATSRSDLPFPNFQLPSTATAPAPLLIPNSQPSSAPASRARAPRWEDAGLPDVTDYPRPWIIAATPGIDPKTDDPITREALKNFRARQRENDFGRVLGNSEKSRMYRYAAAVRAEPSCISCHAEYLPLMPPEAARLLPGAASRPSATEPAVAPTNGWPLVAIIRVDLPYQTDENQLLLNRIVIVVAGMLGGTLAIVVFYLITSRLILQPVRVLKNTAEKVSKGDLNIRSAISTGDEFQQLSETFNAMLTTLSASQAQLEETNRSLDTRVGELAQSNVDLYEANRLKSEFLTNVSHELRTPLNATIGFAELLLDRVKEPKEQRYVENILASARQLLELINDLLDLAKIEAGKLVLREEKVNVADVSEAMLNFMRPLAGKKNIELTADLSVGMPLITTDPGRFQQILYNFLSNAIKFTPNDGKVTIAARPEDIAEDGTARGLRVSVTDSGPGISPENQKYIFEKFRQVDGSVTRQHAGTGLGLAISRELANMLGARIELASELGKGTTFSLIMPIVSARGRTVEVHSALENR